MGAGQARKGVAMEDGASGGKRGGSCLVTLWEHGWLKDKWVVQATEQRETWYWVTLENSP